MQEKTRKKPITDCTLTHQRVGRSKIEQPTNRQYGKEAEGKTYDNGKPIVWPKSLQTFFGGYLLKYSG